MSHIRAKCASIDNKAWSKMFHQGNNLKHTSSSLIFYSSSENLQMDLQFPIENVMYVNIKQLESVTVEEQHEVYQILVKGAKNYISGTFHLFFYLLFGLGDLILKDWCRRSFLSTTMASYSTVTLVRVGKWAALEWLQPFTLLHTFLYCSDSNFCLVKCE